MSDARDPRKTNIYTDHGIKALTDLRNWPTSTQLVVSYITDTRQVDLSLARRNRKHIDIIDQYYYSALDKNVRILVTRISVFSYTKSPKVHEL